MNIEKLLLFMLFFANYWLGWVTCYFLICRPIKDEIEELTVENEK